MELLREPPVLLELGAVERGPLLHEPSGARRQLAFQWNARGDVDARSVFPISRAWKYGGS